MGTYEQTDSSVVVVVGSGAGGGTLANELCQRGVPVVLLEAGRYVSNAEFVNDEWLAFAQMAWLDTRTTSGTWRVARDFPNLPCWTCKLVGGTTTHWAGACPRFRDYEFRIRSEYGLDGDANLLDWPLTLEELEPYYEKAERKIGVTHTHGIPPLPANNNYKVFANGALRLGYKEVHTGPYGTNSVPRDGRPASIQDGFNFQGDKNRSKWSTLVAELPKAQATGKLDLRPQSHVIRITHDTRGLVDGVLYVDAAGALQRQAARVVCVAGNSIETPRLLLLSASPMFPDGLANSSGQVGRNYMRHMTASVYASFERPVRMWRGETMAGVIADEASNDPGRGFVGGYFMETLSLGPAFYAAFVEPGAWGRELAGMLDRYSHTAGLWLVGEDMPRETNRVTLNHDVLDQWGQPVPNVHFDDHPNDERMREHAWRQGQAVFQACGALDTHRTPPYPSTHNLGTCRMSARPEDGVVNRWGQCHDVRNLFIADGSQFTSGAAANPTLTIVTLAIRQAEYLAEQLRAGAV